MIKTTFIGTLLASFFLVSPVQATEYIYRDIMANTLAPEHCQVEGKAKENAAKNYNIDRFSKKFCQSQGYGWHVDEIKSAGNTACDTCSNPQEAKCRQEDVVVSCKRIKPGTVGMLPGKG